MIYQERQGISIHALLAESDTSEVSDRVPLAISIHALLAESDKMHALILADSVLFLSTLSLRRATGAIGQLQCILGDFYPRSPCGERRHPQHED